MADRGRRREACRNRHAVRAEKDEPVGPLPKRSGPAAGENPAAGTNHAEGCRRPGKGYTNERESESRPIRIKKEKKKWNCISIMT